MGTGHYQLRNSSHIYNTMCVNDTVIRYGMGYNWKTYSGGHVPSGSKKYNFKWVLYAEKLRNKGLYC